MRWNVFSEFFLMLFGLLFAVNFGLSTQCFDKYLSHNDKYVRWHLIEDSRFILKHLALSLLFFLILFVFVKICNYFDEEVYEPYASCLASIFGAPVMVFMSIFLVKGFMVHLATYKLPLWALATIFFVNIFVIVSLKLRISGIFILDVLLASIVFTFSSLIFSMGILSVFINRLNYPWKVLLVETGAVVAISRLFLWKYEE